MAGSLWTLRFISLNGTAIVIVRRVVCHQAHELSSHHLIFLEKKPQQTKYKSILKIDTIVICWSRIIYQTIIMIFIFFILRTVHWTWSTVCTKSSTPLLFRFCVAYNHCVQQMIDCDYTFTLTGTYTVHHFSVQTQALFHILHSSNHIIFITFIKVTSPKKAINILLFFIFFCSRRCYFYVVIIVFLILH